MKNLFSISAAFAAPLLLTGCTPGDVGIYFGALIVVTIIVMAVESITRKQSRDDAQSTVMATTSLASENILIDVKGNGGIAVDTKNKQVGIFRGQGADVRPVMFSYRDILSSEIIEDGETVTKTSRGSQIGGALIGGLAFGGVGAIIGGLSGSTKSTGKVSKIALMVTINDVNNPVHYVLLLDETSALDKSASIPKSYPQYKDAMGKAQHWHGKIQVLIRQADEEDRRQEREDAAKTVTVTPVASTADEIAKLGELRDKGVLTEEEFASQKAKLLDS